MKAVTLTRVSFALQGDLIKRFLPLGLTSLFSQISLAAAMAAHQQYDPEIWRHGSRVWSFDKPASIEAGDIPG